MRSRRQNPLMHAWSMLYKNLSTYGLLSLTIILSFALMLSVFIVIDSINYNKYKKILSRSPNLVIFENDLDTDGVSAQEYFAPLIYQLDRWPNSQYFYYSMGNVRLPEILSSDTQPGIFSQAIYVPNYIWAFFGDDTIPEPQTLFNGESNLSLKTGEVIVSETLLKALANEGADIGSEITILFDGADGSMTSGTFKLAGSHRQRHAIDPSGYLEKIKYGSTLVFLPMSAVDEYNAEITRVGLHVYSPFQQRISKIQKDQGYAGANFHQSYLQAMSEQKNAVFIKGIICAATYVILAINLLGAFANALNKRSFEIGVKRAIGASPGQIVLQFFLEGVTVISANIILASLVSVIPFLAYKLYQSVQNGLVWTIYLSTPSAIIYLLNCFVICVVSSLYFAYRSSKVEVITLIKGA